jgi:hypothetical protein
MIMAQDVRREGGMVIQVRMSFGIPDLRALAFGKDDLRFD